jgi:multidrug efflux pump subunit AcrB
VSEALTRLRASYPIGIELDVLALPADGGGTQGRRLRHQPLQAVAVVAAVMFLTLGLRTGVVVATLIPMAMIGVTVGLLVARSYFGFVPVLYSLLFRVPFKGYPWEG